MSTPVEHWHADPAALRDYADGTASAGVAWSIESHLPVCAHCRALLTHAMSGPDDILLRDLRAGLVLPHVQRAATARRAVLAGIFGPWWAWLCFVAITVAVLWLVGEAPLGRLQQQHGLTWGLALSPLVPLAMVATIYAFADRDAATSATPRGGWELLLIRTAAVLGAACPAVTASLWMTGVGVVGWLLPGLGLCLGSLLLGSWAGVERASVTLAAVWAVVVALAMKPGSGLVAALSPAINPEGQGVALWLMLIATAVVVLLWRRERFEIPGGLR